MRILRAADHRVMPWKNGGGSTTEVAVHPEGAGLDTFEWRLSMATVAGDGPFSVFAGIDRTLAVLEGEGIVLSVEGKPDATLTRASQPLSFPADVPISARLIGGPILDFNVMTRRDRFIHRVERLTASHSISPPQAGSLAILLCAAGSATVSSGAAHEALGRHDAAVLDAACSVAVGPGGEIYLVELSKL